MSYVRLSIVTPLPGHEVQVKDLMARLMTLYAQQTGFIAGYALDGVDGGKVGRFSVWDGPQDADRIAVLEHNLAIRAELDRVVSETDRTESSYIAR